MTKFKVGDKVVCVDATPPVPERLMAVKKGKTYVVTGVTRPPHDDPDRPLVQVKLPKPHDTDWWSHKRFQKKGK